MLKLYNPTTMAPSAAHYSQGVEVLPGARMLYIAGQVGVTPDGAMRFIHASYVTHTVIDEPARGAVPIETSKYRVVGKLFSGALLEKWRAQRRIRVLGDW